MRKNMSNYHFEIVKLGNKNIQFFKKLKNFKIKKQPLKTEKKIKINNIKLIRSKKY